VERSFARQVELLKLKAGEEFHGEGILAITKALLQSGVSYVGGYQGAPVSHLMDVLADAQELLDDMGIHFEVCANEAAAAAMLGASINYPMRGAVVWKSTVGTNVASDALSNLASAGVKGGALIILGEDYGEGASIIQERTHAFAMKSTIWLLDPRPHQPKMVELVEKGFQLSEISQTPVMVEYRIRACHMHGHFTCKDNLTPAVSRNHPLSDPDFDYARICLPPATYAQEKHKIEQRFPAALGFIREHRLNELFDGDLDDIGIVTQGGLYNSVIRALQQLDLADAFGGSRIPIYVLNVTYPLVPDEVTHFCAGKRAVLMVEEGNPDYLEQAVNVILRKADLQTRIFGKDVLPMAGEYTAAVMLEGMTKFIEAAQPAGLAARNDIGAPLEHINAIRQQAKTLLTAAIPPRPPSFCTGCPERPVFSALKLVEKDLGKIHISSDIGCHTFSTLPPFNMGNSVMGYGLGLAGSTAVAPAFDKRVVTVMGDGGFWHNGLTSGVANAVFNNNDSVLIVMNNGYTSATGQQYIPSSGKSYRREDGSSQSIQQALKGFGVRWVRTVTTYKVGQMVKTLKDAMGSKEGGLKVIVAESECQLARQRRIRPQIREQLAAGERVVRTRFGVDEETCTGDHSCIRLSGCPSLTVKPNPDPLRKDPVAHVNNGCVGCGLCGEVADAAVLCPSFYRADIVQNPNAWDRWIDRQRRRVINWLQGLDKRSASAVQT
jgi:indolepyruvate ferredoxin oxidoreductase alpha subunit